MLGHGAGGGIDAPDVRVAARVGLEASFAVARVEQPYRVAGRRTPPPAARLDTAWTAVCAALAEGELADLALICGGRSSGARVACRTAAATGARGVLCLAFPLQPPPRRDGRVAPSRAAELDAVMVPVLVVQGTRDRFGMPEPATGRELAVVDGDHALRRDADAIATAIATWLAALRV